MKNAFIIGFILLFILIVVFVQFIYPNLGKKEDDESSIVKYSQIKVFDPVYVALEKGYFEQEKVKVELMGETFGGPQALMAAGNGDVDAGIAATAAILNARNAGIKVKGILDVQSTFLDAPLMKWYVLESSSVTDAVGLAGRRVGVNTLGASFHYTTLEYLKQHGVSLESVEFVVMPHGNLEQALRSGQIDAAGMIDPFSEIAFQRGGLRVLFTAYDVLGENQFSLIFMSEKKIEQNPEAVRKFVRAYQKAINFIDENPDEASEIIAEIFEIEKQYVSRHRFKEKGRVDHESVIFWADFLKEQAVEGMDSIDISQVFTNEFN